MFIHRYHPQIRDCTSQHLAAVSYYQMNQINVDIFQTVFHIITLCYGRGDPRCIYMKLYILYMKVVY